MNKPTIIAVCGKSASGKDTLVKSLNKYLNNKEILNHRLVSDTTRLMRHGEQEGVDYHYISTAEFLNRKDNNYYLEFSEFNGWYYGTPFNQISARDINLGVFNVDGLYALSNKIDDFNICVVYLECGIIKRLIRSIKREHKISFEIIRRIFADEADFKDLKKIIGLFRYKIKLYPNEIDLNTKILYQYLKDSLL